MKMRGVVLHTVGVRGDATVEAIRRYHVEHNGWRDIGYHFLIRKDGKVCAGRPLTQYGAHLEGANDTIGVCVTGDGDSEAWTWQQLDAVVELAANLLTERGLGASKLCGHREGPAFFAAKPVWKTCPGKLIDMAQVRAYVAVRIAYLPGRSP